MPARLNDFHYPGRQDCGHVTQLRCRDCGNCYVCNHDILQTSRDGFGQIECNDYHTKWIPPALMEAIESAKE